MKKFALFLCIALMTACAVNLPAPTPPTLTWQVAQELFASRGNNIGGTFVTDSIAGADIRRITYTPGNLYTLSSPYKGTELETHSLYRIGEACIQAVAEETRAHVGGALIAVQTYTTTPCWVNALTISAGDVITTAITGAPYAWHEMDLDGNILYPATGTWDDKTVLTTTATGFRLVERYEDTTEIIPNAPVPYCGVGLYGKGTGMLSITQDPKACQ